MLCIVAFFVVLVLSAVSAKYRKLLGKAWGCFSRRVTFRPCDSTFRDDIKDQMLAPLALRSPRLVAPASVAIEVTAWLMMVSLVVSVWILLVSALNLFVYGTCDKEDPVACSLSSTQACGIGSGRPSFTESLGRLDIVGAFGNEFADVADTIAAVPGVFRTWDAADHVVADASWSGGYREGLPTALEVIDPGCEFCAQMFAEVEGSAFAQRHNITYIVYPIGMGLVPRFQHSPMVSQYLTAVRLLEADAGSHAGNPTDWFILEQMYTGVRPDGVGWQEWFNETATDAEAQAQVAAWLGEAGYDAAGIAEVAELAGSQRVADAIEAGMRVVDDEIRTVTIPTLVAGGKLHKGAVDAATLDKIGG